MNHNNTKGSQVTSPTSRRRRSYQHSSWVGGVGGGDTKCQHTCAPTRTLSAVPLRDAGTECSRHIQAGGPVCIYVCVLFTSGSTAAVDGGSLQGGRTIAIPARRLAINAAVFCRVCRRGRVGLASTAAAVSQELFLFFFGTEAHRRCTSHSGAVQMMHWHRGSEQQRVPDPEDCARAQRVGHCTPGEFGRPLKYLINFENCKPRARSRRRSQVFEWHPLIHFGTLCAARDVSSVIIIKLSHLLNR